MNPTQYALLSNVADQRYKALLSVFRSLLFTALENPFTTPRVNALVSQARALGEQYMQVETQFVRADLLDTATETVRSAHSDLSDKSAVSLPKDLIAFLDQSERFLLSEIKTQIERDIQSLAKSYRSLSVEARLTGQPPAVVRAKFQFRDRAGRQYASTNFIRTAWNHTLTCLGVEFYLLTAIDLGARKIDVVHPDGKWSDVSITPKHLSGFLQIRDEIFHPNSQSVLKAFA